jgi:hypothetical protein
MKATVRKGSTDRLTASRLRADVYRVLDRVIQTGIPAEIERRGKVLRIAPVEAVQRLKQLPLRPGFIKGDPEDLVHLDWSHEWRQ